MRLTHLLLPVGRALCPGLELGDFGCSSSANSRLPETQAPGWQGGWELALTVGGNGLCIGPDPDSEGGDTPASFLSLRQAQLGLIRGNWAFLPPASPWEQTRSGANAACHKPARGGRWRLRNELVGEDGCGGFGDADMVPVARGGCRLMWVRWQREKVRTWGSWCCCCGSAWPLTLVPQWSLTACPELVSSLCVRDLCPSLCLNWLVRVKLGNR